MPQSVHSKWDRCCSACAWFGALFIVVAITSNIIGLTHGPVDKDRLMLGITGLVLYVLGLFRQRAISAYRWAVLSIVNAVVLLLILNMGAALIHRLTPTETVIEDKAIHEVHKTSVSRQLYVGWRGNAFAGKAIHVGEDGLRVTLPEIQVCAEETVRIFTFGGSTM